MISTNTVKPKEDKRFAKFLRTETDDKGEPTGSIISSIPKRVITTSQKEFVERAKPVLPHNFPPAREVKREKPEKTFIQTSDIRGMEENKKRKELMAKVKAMQKKKAGRPKKKA
uniref:Uncharacterized protein n=1 Tax=viral metagenome TaxID=1070528 RepID=A0A6M3MFI8_9ZZZZ